MTFYPQYGCGGNDTSFQIQIEKTCTTKAKPYPDGTTLYWTSLDDLKDCATNDYIHTEKDSILIDIQPTDNKHWYCISEVVVVLNDQKSSTYTKEISFDWKQGSNMVTISKILIKSPGKCKILLSPSQPTENMLHIIHQSRVFDLYIFK